MAHAVTVGVKGGAQRCLYVPLPRQVEFMACEARRVLFGGAAGGSKSHALRWHGYQACLRTPRFKTLLLRRNSGDLERTHLRAAVDEAPLFGAVPVPSAHLVKFPNESILEMGHCDDTKAVARYLSAEYDLILFDELVTFEREQFLMVASRARSSKPGVKPRVLAGTNPGGPQAHWVRAMFIDKTVDVAEFPNYRPEDYAYIPSKLEDNPYLNEDYEQGLMDLPPELRKAYRDGDWDIFPGQYFPEWRRSTHVSAARTGDVSTPVHLTHPAEYPRVRAVDWGFVKPGWCGWFVLLPDGQVYLEQEYLFSRTVASEVAAEIRRRTQELGVKVRYTVGDTAMWTPDGQTGESIAETFGRAGVPMIQADKDRVNGWQRLRHWFKPSPSGAPWLVSSPACAYFNRTIPSLVSDEHRPEDVDSDGEDHAADACFVGSTRVLTDQGQRPIRDIRVGDRVATRAGWKRVVNAGQSGETTDVVCHLLSSGGALIGTPNHPVYVPAKEAFISMDAVRYGDILSPCPATITEPRGTDGARRTARFQRAITSTIGTAIRKITTSAIWNACRVPFTSATTVEGAGPRLGLLRRSWRKLGCGIARLRAWHGTAPMPPLSLPLRFATASASSVASPLQIARAVERASSVQTTARPHSGDGAAPMRRRASAMCAGETLPATATPPPAPARESAPQVVASFRATTAQAVAVYNLTVEDAPEYYAEGVLVHNCRYFVMSRPVPGAQVSASAQAARKQGTWAWWKSQGKTAARPGLLTR